MLRARISMHVAYPGAGTYVTRMIVAMKLWQCEKKTSSWCVYHPNSLIYSLQGPFNKECLFASKTDGSAMDSYLSVGA